MTRQQAKQLVAQVESTPERFSTKDRLRIWLHLDRTYPDLAYRLTRFLT